MEEKRTYAYDDIIGLPHHRSATRKPMPPMDRAAQFAPFAALTGYEEEVDEAGRLTEREIVPEESDLALLDRRLAELEARLEQAGTGDKSLCPEAEITRFEPDAKKEGGKYVKLRGKVRRVERTGRLLVFCDGRRIPLGQIVSMELI